MGKNPGPAKGFTHAFGQYLVKKNRRFVFGKFVKTCRELDL